MRNLERKELSIDVTCSLTFGFPLSLVDATCRLAAGQTLFCAFFGTLLLHSDSVLGQGAQMLQSTPVLSELLFAPGVKLHSR